MAMRIFPTVVVCGLIILSVGCDTLLNYQVKKDIERLKEAEGKLLQNPGDEAALPVIMQLLHDRNGITRSNAAASLEHVAPSIGSSIKNTAVPALTEMLANGDSFDKRAAALALSSFGKYSEPAIPVLRVNLFPSERDAAWFSAETLGKIGEPASVAVPDLVKVVEENLVDELNYERRGRKYATQALGRMGPSAIDAVPSLTKFLNETDNPVFKAQLSVAIISIDPGNQGALDSAEHLLEDGRVEIRREMIWELKDAGSRAKPAIELVKKAGRDNDPSVSQAASELLSVIER